MFLLACHLLVFLLPTLVTELPFCLDLKTVEAERISVDHVAHLKPSDGGSAATQCNSLLSLILFYLHGFFPSAVPVNSFGFPFFQWLLTLQAYIVL